MKFSLQIRINPKTLRLSLYTIVVTLVMISCDKKVTPPSDKNDSVKTTTTKIEPASPPEGFKHERVLVNGVNIHFVKGGTGEPLLLIHGFGQNWYMWNRLLPELSKSFTVIAPDLRGVGESDKPEGGYDKKNMATDLHELMKSLGYQHANVAGHDIGLMVAYAYAAQYPNDVKKLALLDALLPGIDPVWSNAKDSQWWFGFFARPVSGQLVDGQADIFLKDFWPVVGHVNDAFTKAETDEFIRAYSVPGATTGSFHWFGAFPQDAIDNKELMKQKLNMPVLAMGAEFQSASFLADHSRLVANHVTEHKIPGAGHWIVQEATEEVQKGLLGFFKEK